ncbi:E3 ubiquitin- ligase RBBP6-like protein [Labeo rohita]|uniref:E3 ubiquitin-ligase RBBP6-like protein n=1 Tax=Labeo rohita TaxID=84645 RepID=A0A498MT50_LABRO|nr:E3 ubiquitin- ligase RBBP6-like protein [Labeo rohita]RXN34811.1 E3 ubiquitin- ligase RBBP6-like protein [Labeo rohita]
MRRERLKLCDLQINSAQTNEDESLLLKSSNKRFGNEAYATGKKEKLSFSPQDEHSSSFSTSSDPAVLLCLISKDLLTDAVMIPCCRSSY